MESRPAQWCLLIGLLRRMRPAGVAVVLAWTLLSWQAVNAQVNVTTYHYDNAGTGQN